jgi:high-affinity iron transporter
VKKANLMRRLAPALCLLLMLLTVAPLGAQTPSPAQLAEAARSGLFAAQLALQSADQAAAEAELAEARSALAALAAQLAPLAPAAAEAIGRESAALVLGSPPSFAASRAQLWASVLGGGMQATLAAIERGDTAAAQQWLQVRVFRKANRLTRVSADATTALAAWSVGEISAAQAATVVRADLLDGYVAQTRETLGALTKLAERQSTASAAEQAGLAAGYFAIARAAYAEQRGAAAADSLSATLGALLSAALASDWPTLSARQAEALSALRGFTATPLSAQEIERKGGQLLQFLNLVQLEYAKGVRNGEIVVPLEVQEAQTFYAQANGLFDELAEHFSAKDTAAAQQLSANMAQIGPLLNSTGEPAEVTRLAKASIALLSERFAISEQSGDLVAVQALLTQLRSAAAQGDYATAETIRLQAYAIFEVGPEPKLFSRDFALGDALQAMFWQGLPAQPGLADLIKRKAPLSELDVALALMASQIVQAEQLLGAAGSPLGAISGAVAILVREGLEAVLVLAAIVGYLRATKAPPRATQQVLAGAALAIVASVAVWALARSVIAISAANRELVEGIIGLIAAAVLVSVTNWMLHKAYVVDWISFVKQQVEQAMGSGSIFGLAALGFLIVFREGFETALFFEALLADSPAWAVGVGALLGCAIIAVIAALILRYSVRLPLKPFFTVTSALLMLMALSFVGNGVRNLQEAGLVGVSRLESVPIGLLPSLIGLFPTYETVLAQLALLLVLGATFLIAKARATKQPPGRRAAPSA